MLVISAAVIAYTEKEYEVFISNRAVGKMKTNLGGKLTISVDADKEAVTHVKVVAI